jgi:Kef-type K+ transport system membrane component KefB
MALLLSNNAPLKSALLLMAFVATAALAARGVRSERGDRIIGKLLMVRTDTNQLSLRVALLLVALLVVLTELIGIDLVLGAFTAGMLIRLALGDREGVSEVLRRLDVVGYGIFIPLFFVLAGAALDFGRVAESPLAALAVPVMVTLLLVGRVVPAVLLLPRTLTLRERAGVGLLWSSTLPLVIAITTIAGQRGYLSPDQSTGLVMAALVGMIVFPAVAMRLVASPQAAEQHR